MAFVSQSPKKPDFKNQTSTDKLGPGEYDVESSEHKKLMAALYPKKSAPFNQTFTRFKHKPSTNVPGKHALVLHRPLGFMVSDPRPP